MKFGLFCNTGYYGTGPDQLIAAARHAERCGFESFYLGEHIALYRARPSARSRSRRRCRLPTRWSA